MSLKGKVAVVTGGNGGIGLGFATGLAQAGADIAIWARNIEKSEVAVKKLKSLGFTSENEEHKLLFLTGAYRSALKLAEEYKLEAVAFSLIGSSCRGGKSWKETVAIGLNTIIRFKGYPELKEIHLYGFTEDEATELRERSMEANATFEHMEQLE